MIEELHAAVEQPAVPVRRRRVDLAVLREQATSVAGDCGVCDDCPPAAPVPDPVEAARASMARDAAPLFDDPVLDPSINATLALPQNATWWGRLDLTSIQPLRGLDPARFPNAYANRVIAFQRLATAQTLDTLVLGRAITPDGVFGPETLLLLHAVAVDPELELFAADVTSLGLSLERVRHLGDAAQTASESLALPPELVADWGFRVSAEKMVAYYEADFASAKLETWRRYFAPDGAGDTIEWPHVFELLRRLLGTQTLAGRIGVMRFRRTGPRDGDSGLVAKKIDGSLRIHVWWDLGRTVAKARKILGVAPPTTAAVRGALAELKASATTPPYTRAVLVIQLPEIAESVRRATFDSWFAEHQAKKIGERIKTEDELRDFAASVLLHLGDAKTYAGEKEFAEWVDDTLYRTSTETRQGFFDAVKAQGGIEALFKTFGRMVHYKRRAVLPGLVRDTTYLTDPAYTAFLAEHQRKTNGIRRHRYDFATKTIFLDGDSDARLVVGDRKTGGIVSSVKHIFTRDESLKRPKPVRLKALCKQLTVEVRAMVDEILGSALADGVGTDIDEKTFFEQAVTRAGEKMTPPWSDDDQERVFWECTARVHDLRSVMRDGLPRAEVDYEMVERVDGGHWTPIPETRRWRSEEEFGEELFFLFLDSVADVITVMAYIALAAVAIYFLIGEGVIAGLVKLAGGTGFVLGNIAISIAIYLITSWKTRSWTGFFEAVLMGYLSALGFRLFAPIGRWVGSLLFGEIGAAVLAGRITAGVILRGAAGLVLQKTITGVGSGVFAMVATVFVTDLVRIVREGGGMSSWDRYLDAAGAGAVMGLIGEFLVSPALSVLGGVAKGTVIDKAAQLLGGSLGKLKELTSVKDVAKALRAAKPALRDFGIECAEGLARFSTWLRSVLTDSTIAANGIKAMRARIKPVLDELFTAAGRATVRGVDNLGESFLNGVLDLAEAGFSRQAARGLRRLARQVGVRITSDQLDQLIASLRTKPTAIDPVLGLLGVLDVQTVKKLLDPDRLFELAQARNVHALVSAFSLAEVRTLLQRGFGGEVRPLEAWARRVLALSDTVRADVMRVARESLVSPEALIELAEQGVALDPFTVAALERLSAMEKNGSLAEILRQKLPDRDGLLALAGTDATAEAALRALLEDPARAGRLLRATESANDVRRMIDAAHGNAATVDRLLKGLPRRVGTALRLEDTELEGLLRLLAAARNADEIAAVSRLLGDPYTANARMRAASRSTRGQLRTAIEKGAFPAQYVPRKMSARFRRYDADNGVPQLTSESRLPYRVTVRDGLLCRDDGTPLHIEKTPPDDTRALYVMRPDGEIYVRPDDPWTGPRRGRFHHSSFLSGRPIGGAGELEVVNGKLTYVSRASGHYDTQPEHLAAFLDELRLRGVDVSGARIVQ